MNNKINNKIQNQIREIHERIDKIVDRLEMQDRKVCCESRPNRNEEIQHKTYEMVKRMKFNSDMKLMEERYQKIENEIKTLEKEKEYITAERNNIEKKYYEEF